MLVRVNARIATPIHSARHTFVEQASPPLDQFRFRTLVEIFVVFTCSQRWAQLAQGVWDVHSAIALTQIILGDPLNRVK